jgi:phospholipid N-methyltransferase
MPNEKPNSDELNGRLVFIQEFLKHPLRTGTFVRSSRFLERRIVATAEVASADVVVELGPGTGGTTRAILRTLPKHGRLLCIELNPHFHALVSSIHDSRLIVHLGSACELKEIFSRYHLDAPKAIVSGIPFSTISHEAGSRILEAVCSLLADDGFFVAYQVSNRVATLCQPFLGSGQTATEFLNIPPMRIFRWGKNGANKVN